MGSSFWVNIGWIFLIEGKLIVEAKAVYDINNFHMAQVLSYLKTFDKKLGPRFKF